MAPPAASASAGDTVHAPGTGQAVDVSKAQLPAVLPAGLHVLFMIVESEPALKTIDILSAQRSKMLSQDIDARCGSGTQL